MGPHISSCGSSQKEMDLFKTTWMLIYLYGVCSEYFLNLYLVVSIAQ